jgi:putative ABC transport system permease protein
MGSDGFRVVRIAFIGDWDPKKYLEMERRNPQIHPDEWEFIRDHAHLLSAIGMETSRNVTISYKGTTMQQVELDGMTAEIPAISNMEVALGRTPTETEIRRHAPVAFIGEDINQKFFSDVDPLGKNILVDGVQYGIIGVAKAKGSVFGQSQDGFVAVPIYSYFKTYGLNLHTDMALFAKAADSKHLDEAKDEVRMLLRASRRLRPQDDDTFSIFGSDTLSNAWQNLTGAITGMAFAVVSVFLVVREIGIRKSLGARRRDILNQFLVESAVLAMMGGLIGVAVAFLVAVVVRNATPLPMEMPLASVALGVGLSATVGLFFGIYPARQAAKLDPIIALQSD